MVTQQGQWPTTVHWRSASERTGPVTKTDITCSLIGVRLKIICDQRVAVPIARVSGDPDAEMHPGVVARVQLVPLDAMAATVQLRGEIAP